MSEVKRDKIGYLYTSLDWGFIRAMARLGLHGSDKYDTPGDPIPNWKQGVVLREKSPVNHMAEHMAAYNLGEHHDHFGCSKWHLVAIAFNAMIEFFHYTEKPIEPSEKSFPPESSPQPVENKKKANDTSDHSGRSTAGKTSRTVECYACRQSLESGKSVANAGLFFHPSTKDCLAATREATARECAEIAHARMEEAFLDHADQIAVGASSVEYRIRAHFNVPQESK